MLGKADLLAHFRIVFYSVCVIFPYGVLGQVWFWIVLIPDHCLPLYFRLLFLMGIGHTPYLVDIFINILNAIYIEEQKITFSFKLFWFQHTGQPRYVKLCYLEYTAYVEVIIHFPNFSPILHCNSILLMSNSVIMKTRLFRSDFSFPKANFPFVYHCLYRSGQKVKPSE